jgi:fimbrial isopeptide formation D2 family protein
MFCPRKYNYTTLLFSFLLLISLVLVNGISRVNAQQGTSTLEVIDADSLIIAMDNVHQGDAGACGGPAFNLKAYGLAVTLLNNNIPLKWAISSTKTSKDGTDFTANVTRISGANCENGSTNEAFSGGPLIIPAAYKTAAISIINSFNSPLSNSQKVRVYNVNSSFTAPIRYTLTHKPKIAVGPDGGGFGSGIYQQLFDDASIDDAYWDNVSNSALQQGSCYTIAMQAHAADDAVNFISNYKNFALQGGNLFFQCYSVDVFENNLANGLFQTTNGWTVRGTNDNTEITATPQFPNVTMPFNQFIGGLADTDGRVTEFQLKSGSNLKPGVLVSAVNPAPNGDVNIATVSRIGSSTAGGNVFELGGHDYSRNVSGTTELTRTNGRRMALNAILVPATRSGCGLSIPSVKAFKGVRMSTDNNGNGQPNVGDVVEWEVKYINDSSVTITNFQVTDTLNSKLTFVGPLTVTATSGSTAAANASYNGTSNVNLLQSGASLAPGGKITIKIKTTVNNTGTIPNQAIGNGTGISNVKTDTIDSTTPGTVAGYNIGCDTAPTCLSQAPYQTSSNEDPTVIELTAGPSAGPATVGGRVIDASGRGISRATVTLVNASNGESRYAFTNSFGYFSFNNVQSGEFYVLTVSAARYTFPNGGTVAFQLEQNLTDLVFQAGGISGNSFAAPPATGNSSRFKASPY